MNEKVVGINPLSVQELQAQGLKQFKDNYDQNVVLFNEYIKTNENLISEIILREHPGQKEIL